MEVFALRQRRPRLRVREVVVRVLVAMAGPAVCVLVAVAGPAARMVARVSAADMAAHPAARR